MDALPFPRLHQPGHLAALAAERELAARRVGHLDVAAGDRRARSAHHPRGGPRGGGGGGAERVGRRSHEAVRRGRRPGGGYLEPGKPRRRVVAAAGGGGGCGDLAARARRGGVGRDDEAA